MNPPERQASITGDAVPAKVRDIESFAGHGLNGIPEGRLHMSDFYRHVRSKSAISTASHRKTDRPIIIQYPFCASSSIAFVTFLVNPVQLLPPLEGNTRFPN